MGLMEVGWVLVYNGGRVCIDIVVNRVTTDLRSMTSSSNRVTHNMTIFIYIPGY